MDTEGERKAWDAGHRQGIGWGLFLACLVAAFAMGWARAGTAETAPADRADVCLHVAEFHPLTAGAAAWQLAELRRMGCEGVAKGDMRAAKVRRERAEVLAKGSRPTNGSD